MIVAITDSAWRATRTSLASTGDRFTDLVRAAADPSAPATRHWSVAAHAGLGGLGGLGEGGAAPAFAAALLASGLSSSGVGTSAGRVVTRGFVRRGIPLITALNVYPLHVTFLA
ncbi:hypothetical protein ABGB18_03500 [Nonomuraea sp. B12E4]|uniref:hypothetical protein n=1 Tax=Nonomuraea sp. B12E4 TaxID=3153564 RepID=UPI00325EBDA7